MSERELPSSISIEDGEIYVIEPGIVYWREPSKATPFTLTIVKEFMEQVLSISSPICILLDASLARVPRFQYMLAMREFMASISARVMHIAIATDGNVMLRFSIKYMTSRIRVVDFSVYENQEQALQHLRSSRDTKGVGSS